MERALAQRIEDSTGSPPARSAPVGGGSIGRAFSVRLDDGRTVFVKTREGAPPDMFPEEARGLAALGAGDGPRTPRVFHADAELIILEFLEPGRVGPKGWERLGRELARLHRTTSERHGFDADNYIGATPQPNPWTDDGVAFFAEHRLGFQVSLARSRGLLDDRLSGLADRLVDRLDRLLPDDEPACLLHGDLWTGNVHGLADGTAALVDPAVYYGYREADLAMSRLFGQLPGAFYAAYEEAWPLEPGASERVDLFNLYHLLNHLNLFGRGYLGQVGAVLEALA